MRQSLIRPIVLASVVGLFFATIGPSKIAAQGKGMPLADLHFHAQQRLSPEEALHAMDRAGVRWAGNGAQGKDDLWLPFAQAAPDRFIPFVGQGSIMAITGNTGEAGWTLKSPGIIRYLKFIEENLWSGKFRGIGELMVNNLNSRAPQVSASRYPADSPLMVRMLSLAATYEVPLDIHMEADPASLKELERLLPMDRKATVIWAHCGTWADASLATRMMAEHLNLWCELSQRDDRQRGLKARNLVITDSRRVLKPDWKALLEKYSDRFLVGTDNNEEISRYQGVIDFFQATLAQLSPEAARRIGYENAQRLFRLNP